MSAIRDQIAQVRRAGGHCCARENPKSGVERAVAAVGSARALAFLCGVQEAAVSKWRAKGYVPVAHMPAITRATGVTARYLMDPEVVRIVLEETR